MNKSLKYILSILIISLIIAVLCCTGDEELEEYSEYPFEDAKDDLPSMDTITDLVFKYNSVIEEDKEQDSDSIINEMKEGKHGPKERKRIKYSKLKDISHGRYMPYEQILHDDELYVEKKIKKDGTVPSQIKVRYKVDISGMGKIGLDDVKERSISGDFYHEPNSCKGEWSSWNKQHCGGEKDHCGIQYKKYEITEVEKNDENGPGKPCEYKDGEIKYRYCKGNGNDDYESNMERCKTPNNSCLCKLNDDSVMVLEGENVYDLEDEDCNFQREINCICPPNYSTVDKSEICKLVPGEDCSINEPGCIYNGPSQPGGESCKIPDFINKEAEGNFYKNYSSFDGKCQENKCTCDNGSPAEGSECTVSGTELCDLTKPCNKGYYYGGNPPKCIEQTPRNECSCLYGNPQIDTNTERCASSELDNNIKQYCNPIECVDGYESRTLTDCDKYYPPSEEGGVFVNVKCCVPKFNRCILEEESLNEKNITRKTESNKYSEYMDKTIGYLLSIYTGDIGQDQILNKPDPKQFLIQHLLKEEDDDNGMQKCMGRFELKGCLNSFRCKPGHAFLPDSDYSSENELRMVSCSSRGEFEDICEPTDNCERGGTTECKYPSNSDESNKCSQPSSDDASQVPTCDEEGCSYKNDENFYPLWNGTCVPVTCPISSEVKELYNIPYDTCTSNNENCGLSTISCKKAEYNVPNINKIIYCNTPSKVDSSYLLNDYELIHSGCSKDAPQRTRTTVIEDSIIDENAETIASNQVSSAGIDVSNIDSAVDFRGSTSEQQLDLAIAIEETRQRGESARMSTSQEERDEEAQARLDATR